MCSRCQTLYIFSTHFIGSQPGMNEVGSLLCSEIYIDMLLKSIFGKEAPTSYNNVYSFEEK